MLENRINQGFVVYISSRDGKLNGTGLKRLDNGDGLLPIFLDEDRDIEAVYNFSNICRMLDDGNMLQIYSRGNGIISSIGKLGYEGPYAETRCFDEVTSADGVDLVSSLKILDNNVLLVFQGKNKKIKRKYRLYGEDKFK